MSSAPCIGAIADSRNIDLGPREVAKHCWEILRACLPSSNFEMIAATEATLVRPDDTSVTHDLFRSEFFRYLRSTLPPGSTS
jgi:hypothetical protein